MNDAAHGTSPSKLSVRGMIRRRRTSSRCAVRSTTTSILAPLGQSLHLPVIVDLEGVTFINSLGVRTWVAVPRGPGKSAMSRSRCAASPRPWSIR